MKRHQVLTGSANLGNHCYSVGQISSFTFWAYGSGCDLVVSNSSQQPIQIISGLENVLITAVDCSESNGKIAVAYGNKITIYKPDQHAHQSGLSYRWTNESSFVLPSSDGHAEILSWNYDGDQLLVGCSVISLWSSSKHEHPVSVSFHLHDDLVTQPESSQSISRWEHVWSSGLNEKPIQLAFSPTKSQCQLFASVAPGECMIKVWYSYIRPRLRRHNVLSKSSASNAPCEYTFTYLLHPQPVVGFEWRKNFLSAGSERFSNVLISSSNDQICRIWVETKQPVSRLLRFQNMPSSDEHNRKRKQNEEDATIFKKAVSTPILTDDLEMTFWNPLHSKNTFQGVRHFHIAATINPLSDIPLLPSITVQQTNNGVPVDENASIFTVHWLNNKFYQNQLLHDKFMCARYQKEQPHNHDFTILQPEDETSALSSPTNVESYLSHAMTEKLIKSWRDSRDALFSIHPSDGSLLVWHIEWLDEDRAGLIRQPQVCFSSRIPMVFSSGDAATLCPRVILFVNHSTEQNLMHSASFMSFKSTNSNEQVSNSIIYSDVKLLSKHNDGSLNLWQISFSDVNDFSSITSISHSSRYCGHCFHMSDIMSHPILPLLITTASHNNDSSILNHNQLSELILWRVDPVGPLLYSGGLSELARVSCQENHLFTKVAWFPLLFPSWCLGTDNNSPSTGLIAFNNNKLQIYQAVVDAGLILADIITPMSDNFCALQHNLISQQSSVHPGCILHLLTVKDEGITWGKILFLETFTDTVMASAPDTSSKTHFSKFSKKYYVVMLEQSSRGVHLHTWKITFSASLASVRGNRSRKTTVRMTDSSEDDSEEEIIMENSASVSNVAVDVLKLSVQNLDFPSTACVLDACSGAGKFNLIFTADQDEHLYPAPYHLCTACDDGHIYFWLCNMNNIDKTESCTWEMWKPSKNHQDLINGDDYSIFIPGKPVLIKAANSTLIACMSVHEAMDEGVKFIISIYECASSGGSCWKAQDTIEYIAFSDVHLPECELQSSNFHLDWLSREEGSFFLAIGYETNVQIFSLAPRDIKSEHSKKTKCVDETATSKHDGHSQHKLLKQSSLDVHTRQKLFTTSKAKSIEKSFDFFNPSPRPKFDSQIQWRLLRWTKLTELNVGNSRNILESKNKFLQNPEPITVSWARDGILVVATETEMHVFSQWMMTDCRGCKTSNVGHGSVENRSLPLTNGLPEVAELVCPSLQQYHPVVLSELMNSGHLDAVREILVHLAVCMNGDFYDTTCEQESLHIEKYQFSDQLANILQLCSSGNRITPLPLHEVLGINGKINSKFSNAKKPEGKHTDIEDRKPDRQETFDDFMTLDDDLENVSDNDDELDEILGIKSNKKKANKQSEHVDLTNLEPNYFGKEHCKVIHEFLIRNSLPGLTSLDQMELMALADTLEMANASSTKQNGYDEAGYSDQSNAMGLSAGERGYAVSGGGAGALDNCGLRFIMAMHNHLCLLNSLPASNRAALLKQGLDTCQFAWAFHSETEEEMLSLLPSVQRGSPEWEELCSLGAGWWIRSTALLRRLVEQTARAAFLKKNDPLDASLFYLALNKKSVLCGLFRSVKDLRMSQFFQHNFSEERWRRAALKNAFALMGKQRFQHAAAFFLLAGSVRDAVEVCIEKLKDLQLALLIVRLRENPDISHHQLLLDHVLAEERNTSKGLKQMHSDSFVRSMAYWTLGRYDKAVSTLLDDIQHEDITDIFNFYIYLRSHPIVLRNKVQNGDMRSIEQVDSNGVMENASNRERQLIFQTAVVHLEAGCPMLALDSLSKLPKFMKECDQSLKSDAQKDDKKFTITESNVGSFTKIESVADVDWSQPVDLDGGDDLELDWSEDDEDEESDDASRPKVNITIGTPDKLVKQQAALPVQIDVPEKPLKQDVFAQHLRMTACFKIFVQELKAIANAYNTDGGQLRCKLYMWLENASSVLHSIFGLINDDGCNDGSNLILSKPAHLDSSSDTEDSASAGSHGAKLGSSQAPSLHELILADNQDWKTRRTGLARRRKWLQSNHKFLRTLLSYCNLHDSAYGLLATMRMELLLLLQESLQDKTMSHPLSSPLPSPSGSIPLITSSVASCRTVVADPLTNLCHMTRDILRAVLCFTKLPHPNDETKSQDCTLLCSQAAALSTCIYQSLCDTSTPSFRSQLLKADTFSLDGVLDGVDCPSPPALSSSAPHQTSDTPVYVAPTTAPSHWPGVAMLQAMLNTEMSASESRAKIVLLLCEATVAVYVSLLVHALQTHNTSLLYRITNHKLGSKMWNAVFGGGVKIHIKYTKSHPNLKQAATMNVSKIRDRLNHKILHPPDRKGSVSSSGGKETSYREKFVPPEISLWDWFLTKPFMIPSNRDELDFDSDQEGDDISVVSQLSDDASFTDDELCHDDENLDQTNCDSYSWKLMRCAIVQVVTNNLQTFLPLAGFEMNELSTNSPLLCALFRLLQEWQTQLTSSVEECGGPPPDFLPSSSNSFTRSLTMSPSRPAMLRYQVMLEPNNTPFTGGSKEIMGCQRLWHSLVKKETLQETFIRYIFQKKDTGGENALQMDDGVTANTGDVPKSEFGSPVRILHKDNELVAAFCINNVNTNCIALATAKDVQEIDLSDLLESDTWAWVDETTTAQTDKMSSNAKDDDFLFITVPSKQTKTSQGGFNPSSSVPWASTSLTGQGANILMKRTSTGIRRMDSHPTLPYYLTGNRDGAICMWEWGHQQQISQFRPPGQSAKVSSIYFSSLGNKVSSVDGDGYLTMWQVSSSQKPFLRHHCHDRGASDFCFISSSSILATAGLSSTHRNVAIWDTLMPRRSILVKDFTVHEQTGASCVKYLSRYRTLLVAGKNGHITTFDDRCLHGPVHKFAAHDAPIKCLAIDPHERFYVTGSTSGDVKIWGSLSHKLIYSCPNEHARSSLFRNFGSGTVQATVTNEYLLTCGADGSLKMKTLPEYDI